MSEKPFRNIDDIDNTNTQARNEDLDDPSKQRITSSVIGSGANAVYSDARGTWWGDPDPDEAPIFITVKGEVNIRATAINPTTSITFYDKDGNLSILIGFENV